MKFGTDVGTKNVLCQLIVKCMPVQHNSAVGECKSYCSHFMSGSYTHRCVRHAISMGHSWLHGCDMKHCDVVITLSEVDFCLQ